MFGSLSFSNCLKIEELCFKSQDILQCFTVEVSYLKIDVDSLEVTLRNYYFLSFLEYRTKTMEKCHLSLNSQTVLYSYLFCRCIERPFTV